MALREQDMVMIPASRELITLMECLLKKIRDILYASICPLSDSMTLQSCGHFVKYSR
jgi:hypothetical protein